MVHSRPVHRGKEKRAYRERQVPFCYLPKSLFSFPVGDCWQKKPRFCPLPGCMSSAMGLQPVLSLEGQGTSLWPFGRQEVTKEKVYWFPAKASGGLACFLSLRDLWACLLQDESRSCLS